jgi:hypothetical protein
MKATPVGIVQKVKKAISFLPVRIWRKCFYQPACRSGTQAGDRELGLGSGYPTRPNEFVQHIGRQPDNVVLAGSGGPLEACGYDKRGIIVETLDKLYYHYIFKISFNKYFE